MIRQDKSHATVAAKPSDVVLRLVKLPVIVLGGCGVSPDASVTGQAALETAPAPGHLLLLLIMCYSCSSPLGLLCRTQSTCTGQIACYIRA